MRASRLLCQTSIEYWSTPTTIIMYISIFAVVNQEMLHLRNYQDCPPKRH